jgi:protein SCO1/2
VALIGGIWLSVSQEQHITAPPELASASLLLPARETADVTLIDQNGDAFGKEQLKGSYHFFFFGYTNCPDICPATLYQFKILAKKLQDFPEILAKTHFVLVSIDPQRDTASHLKEYVEYYHPDFIGLTGPEPDIKTFSRQMGVIYERRPAEDPSSADQYLVDHSSAVLLTNPAGQLQAVFSAPHEPDRILKDYLAIYQYLEQRT